jgi:RNA polymerase sigma factor (sigma-70 family)
MNTNDAPVRACDHPFPKPGSRLGQGEMRGDESELYGRYHRRLVAITRRRCGSAHAEDAVQFAWIEFLCQPNRDRAYGWLALTARREAVRLAQRIERERASDGPHPKAAKVVDLPLGERAEHPVSLEDRIEAREALDTLAALPERQRRVLARKAAGLSYREIQRDLGWSYTQVNRHLTRARRSLRHSA